MTQHDKIAAVATNAINIEMNIESQTASTKKNRHRQKEIRASRSYNMDPCKPNTNLFDVYLRLRPSSATDRERFLDVEASPTHTPTHITIKPPTNDNRKRAVEKFAFTQVFEEHAGQREIFEKTGALGLIEGVLGEGRDGLVATLGVTGSGKVRYYQCCP